MEDKLRMVYIRLFYFRPPSDPMKPLKALVYDSWFDKFKGIICNIAVQDGVLLKGENNLTLSSIRRYVAARFPSSYIPSVVLDT